MPNSLTLSVHPINIPGKNRLFCPQTEIILCCEKMAVFNESFQRLWNDNIMKSKSLQHDLDNIHNRNNK